MPSLEPSWAIYICAIPSELRHICRTLLIHFAAETVHNWLISSRPSTWYQGRKTLTVLVEPRQGTVEFKEAA